MHFPKHPLSCPSEIAIFPSTAQLQSTWCDFYCRNAGMLFDHQVSVDHSVSTIYMSEKTQRGIQLLLKCYRLKLKSSRLRVIYLNCTESYQPQTCGPWALRAHCLGEDKIRFLLFGINCVSNQIGAKILLRIKPKQSCKNSYLDPILFSIYANSIEQVAWSSLSFQRLYHSAFCKCFIVPSYKWATAEF